jgi:hypothetical protein
MFAELRIPKTRNHKDTKDTKNFSLFKRVFPGLLFLALFLFIFISLPIPAAAAPAMMDDGRVFDAIIELWMGYGYRQDALDWNIAGNTQGTNPNILSELTWEDLIIHEFRLGARAWFKKAFCIRGEIHYGSIVSGENQDSDYLEDDREAEFSRSNNDAGNGNTLDTSIALGYAFKFGTDFFWLTPLIGYSYHEQNLRMTDGYQTVTWDGGPPLGSFPGLDSSYETQWKGFWVGLEPRLELKKISRHLRMFTLYAGYEHHWLNYSAVADWNLRSDFQHPKSFEHEADGQGDVFICGILTELNKNWLLDIGYEQRKWSTDSGIDRVYLVNGVTLETQLNEVNWESSVIKMEIRFIF